MKMILTLIMVFAFNALADVGPVGRSHALDNLGASKGPLEQWFIYVKNVSGSTINDGDVVIADFGADGDNGYAVTTTTTAGQFPLCVMAESCADDANCKCQTYGLKTNVNFDAGLATAGDYAYIDESAAGSVSGIASPDAKDTPVGVFYDTSSTSGDVEVFIRLR